MVWNAADAKEQFDEVIARALAEGPQRIVQHNNAVVLLSQAEYHKLIGKGGSFKAFLLRGPDLSGVDLDRHPSSPEDCRPVSAMRNLADFEPTGAMVINPCPDAENH